MQTPQIKFGNSEVCKIRTNTFPTARKHGAVQLINLRKNNEAYISFVSNGRNNTIQEYKK
jgi:hypothetical protein